MIFYIRPLEEFLAENYVCIWLNIIYSENGYLSIKKINSFKKEFEFKCKITFDWFVIGNEIFIDIGITSYTSYHLFCHL